MLLSYSGFVLNQLHVLVCLNNRVTCVRLSEHMNMFQGSFCVPIVKHSLLRVFPQLSKSIERIVDLGREGSNGEKVRMRRAGGEPLDSKCSTT